MRPYSLKVTARFQKVSHLLESPFTESGVADLLIIIATVDKFGLDGCAIEKQIGKPCSNWLADSESYRR